MANNQGDAKVPFVATPVRVADVETLKGHIEMPEVKLDEHGNRPALDIDADYMKLVQGLDAAATLVIAGAVRDVRELNGTGDVAGVAASFIKESEYFQSVSGTIGNADVHKTVFMGLNYVACGKGVGGLLGAAIRWTLRAQFKEGREFKHHNTMPAGSGAAVSEYKNTLNGKHELVNFFLTNALSVAALAGAMMNKTGHHWNSDHRAPQVAFVKSLGLEDHFNDLDYRKVFYVAVHPLPLVYTEAVRVAVADGRLNDVAEVVRLRCGGPPCGFGVVNVCAAAVFSLLAEPWMTEAHFATIPEIRIDPDADQAAIAANARRNRDIARKNRENEAIIEALPGIRAGLKVVYETNQKLCNNASEYHIFAVHYGYAERKYLDMVPLTHAMCLLAAYIMSKVGGTLSKSPALVKFVAQHSRAVTKATRAFDNETEGESLYDVLASQGFLTAQDLAVHQMPANHVNANHQNDGNA